MKFLYSDDPIIACSTSTLGNAAMAVIRISGFKSLTQFVPFFQRDLSGPIEPRHVYYTKLVLQGQIIDDICFTYFEGPKSYNGEHILELSIHGNSLNTERVLEIFVNSGGCRLAEPGEFTYRALKNKKLSLSQVEGLDLFLNANSTYALDQGYSLLSGNLHSAYEELYDLFLKHKSSLELSIDFSEDIGEKAAKDYFFNTLEEFIRKFKSLVKRVTPLDSNLIRPEIVIAGLPNSGKSSLFNHLLSEERAIVSSQAGTTRDYLTETILIEGTKYRLIDTAGIRNSRDSIEAEGIKRTRQMLANCFFSILLVNPFEIEASFAELLLNKFDVIYFTHSDLPGFEDAKDRLILQHPLLAGPIGAINLYDLPESFDVVLQGQINKKFLEIVSSKPILLDRHKSLITQASIVLEQYQLLAISESDVAILSQELNSLGHCVSELIGIISPEQVLNSIFSNFCIGK